MKKTILGVLVLACGLLAGVSDAQTTTGTVTESETGTTFPTNKDFGGKDHTLIGVGAFEAFGAVDVYGAAFYVETDGAKRSWQRFLERQAASFVQNGTVNWSDLKDSNSLYQWIHSGSFGKGIAIKMVRDVSRQQVIDLHENLMRRLVENYDVAIAQSPLKDYVDATCVDGSAGDELFIWTRGSTVWVKNGGRPLVTIENATSIIRTVWQLWFGSNPISVPLRRALVGHVENLGNPAPAAP